MCYVHTPEEDHIGRNVVYIKNILKFAPRYLQHYTFLLCALIRGVHIHHEN